MHVTTAEETWAVKFIVNVPTSPCYQSAATADSDMGGGATTATRGGGGAGGAGGAGAAVVVVVVVEAVALRRRPTPSWHHVTL